MAEAGQHEEGTGTASSQCPPPDLLRRAHSPRGDREEGAAEEREETHKTGQKSTESICISTLRVTRKNCLCVCFTRMTSLVLVNASQTGVYLVIFGV